MLYGCKLYKPKEQSISIEAKKILSRFNQEKLPKQPKSSEILENH